MKILIINQPLNNRGDESAHKALIRAILAKLPSVSICVLWIGENPDSIRQFAVTDKRVEYVNLKNIRGFNRIIAPSLRYFAFYFLNMFYPTFWHLISYYKKADWVICAPGGICMGGFQNWMHLYMLKMAKYLNKPLIYYGRSFGPFPTYTKANRMFKKISLEMLNYFSFLSIRDRKTEELADELNLKYISTVDTAFLDSPKVNLPAEIISQIGNKDYLVFVPNLLIWHYKYKNRLTKEAVINFYKHIIDKINLLSPSLNIVMLPQTFNYGTYLGDDINLFRDIQKETKNSNIIIIEDKYSSDIQQTIISRAKFLIGARYHSIVFAINNNIPFIALSYEHKISGLLMSLGKTDRIVDITNLSNNDNMQILENIEKCMLDLKTDDKALIKAKDMAYGCFDKLIDLLSTKDSKENRKKTNTCRINHIYTNKSS